MDTSRRRLTIVLALAIAAFLLMPWYRIDSGFYSFRWLSGCRTAPDCETPCV